MTCFIMVYVGSKVDRYQPDFIIYFNITLNTDCKGRAGVWGAILNKIFHDGWNPLFRTEITSMF